MAIFVMDIADGPVSTVNAGAPVAPVWRGVVAQLLGSLCEMELAMFYQVVKYVESNVKIKD